jgi:S-adenosylmethionine synthetase
MIKSQVTIEYSDDNVPQYRCYCDSTQHDPFDEDDDKMLLKIKKDLVEILIPRLETNSCLYAKVI